METIYSEYWNHARQCINERLWFTNIYAVVLAAILVFSGKIEFNQQADFVLAFFLASFGLVLSVIGYFVVIAVSLGYDHYIGDITMILYYWDKMEFYRHPEKPATFRDVHRLLYEITIALFAALLLFYACLFYAYRASEDCNSPTISLVQMILLIVAFIAIFSIIKILYHCRWKWYATECKNFKKALQYDFDGEYREKWDKYFKDPRRKGIATKAKDIRKEVIDKAGISPDKECWICEKLKVVLSRKSKEEKTDQGKQPGETDSA